MSVRSSIPVVYKILHLQLAWFLQQKYTEQRTEEQESLHIKFLGRAEVFIIYCFLQMKNLDAICSFFFFLMCLEF